MQVKNIILLCAIAALCGCTTMRKISDTGRNVFKAISQIGEAPFDAIDGAIGQAENLKTNITQAVKGTNAVAVVK